MFDINTLNVEFLLYFSSGVSLGLVFGLGVHLVGFAFKYLIKTFTTMSH